MAAVGGSITKPRAPSRVLARWLAFGLGAVLVVQALGWATWAALRVEAREVRAAEEAERSRALDEALWRMDAVVASLLARESSRPPSQYRAEIGVLAGGPVPPIVLHFERDGSGELTTPWRDVLAPALLADLAAMLEDAPTLAAADRPIVLEAEDGDEALSNRAAFVRRAQVQSRVATEQDVLASIAGADDEVAAEPSATLADVASTSVVVSELRPRWAGDEALLFVRTVRDDAGERLQGVWLDWPDLRAELIASAADVLPGARLEAVGLSDVDSAAFAGRLASIPARVVMPPRREVAIGWTPLRSALAVAWVALAVAIAAVAALLASAGAQARSRERFIAAAAHQLRTPATTFKLYTQLLASERTPEDKRAGLLGTLRDESDRMARLVEQVLDVARSGDRHLDMREHNAGTLFAEIGERMAAASQLRDRKMVVHVAALEGVVVRADADVVERILTALVENSWQHGEGRIEMRAVVRGGRVRIDVRDEGNGSHRSGPGLGLGLAKAAAERLGGAIIPLENGGVVLSLRVLG
ncbi:MAG: HAMP domain-containing sensor histidine kinase [Planctomycetota bacterium]